jgi:Zn-dependent peptidase ImmA (M78 family)
MIFIQDGVPIIGVNALHHPNRQRFTISHECGHLVLHRDQLDSEVHVDKSFPVLLRSGLSSQGTNKIEIEANRFAAELLVPSALLDQALTDTPSDIEDDAPLEALARKFRVSKQTLEYRLKNYYLHERK